MDAVKRGFGLAIISVACVISLRAALAQSTSLSGNVIVPGDAVNAGSVSASGGAQPAEPVASKTLPLKATYSVSKITKAQVRNASPATSAQTILNQQPSIAATQSGPNGMRTNITFRSFNSGQFSETFEGIAVNDIFNSGVTNQASNRNNVLVTTNDFDGVDIYRGINNPAVNSYNSLGGTINYKAREPTDGLFGEAGFGYGSFNTFDYHASINSGVVGGLKQMVSVERQTSDGWQQNTSDQNNNLYYAAETPFLDGLGKIYGNFIYNTNTGFTPHTVPIALIDQFGQNYEWPTNETYSYNKDTNYFFLLGTTVQLASNINLDVKGFFGENDYTRTSYGNPAFAQPNFLYALPNTGSNPAHAYHLYGYFGQDAGIQPSLKIALPHNMITIGGNVTAGTIHSREYFSATAPVPIIPGVNNFWNEHDQRTLGSIYVQDEISLFNDRLKITPGVKYLYANTKDHDDLGYYYAIAGSVSNTEHYTSPTIGASYELLPGLDAYAAYGQNIKFPDISAYYGNVAVYNPAGNPIVEPLHVQPEYVKDYEVGLRYETGGFGATVDYYREDFANTFVTVTDPLTQVSTTSNGGSSRYQGEELQLTNDFGPIFAAYVPGDWSGYFNYAHNEANFTSSFTDSAAGSVTAGQPLANVPDNLISLGGAWNWNGWRASADGQYVSSEYLNQSLAGTPTNFTTPPYFVLNLGVEKTIPVKLGIMKALVVAFHVDNLFNRRYFTQESNIKQDSNGNNYASVLVGQPQAFYGSITAKF
jgi:outer membrane receptor protein involved in Fe transport